MHLQALPADANDTVEPIDAFTINALAVVKTEPSFNGRDVQPKATLASFPALIGRL